MRRGLMRAFALFFWMALCANAQDVRYTLIHEGQSGKGPMEGFLSASKPLWLSDPLSAKPRRFALEGRHALAYDEQALAAFCVSSAQEGPEACHLLMQPNFGFSGVQEVLLGGRGERLVYVELARCAMEERMCLWPHRHLGQAVVLTLVKQGFEPKVFTVKETYRSIVIGPFRPEESEAALLKIAQSVPAARLIGENEVR